MRTTTTIVLGLLASIFFSGCSGHSYWMHADTIAKNGKVGQMNINVARAPSPLIKTYDYKGYKEPRNVNYQCSNAYMLHAIATKALENGYNYFTLEFTEGSNKRPLAINRVSQHLNYCNAPYYDAQTDLLEDKCQHTGLGTGAPGTIRNVKAYFHKKKNPLVPMWNASRTKRDAYMELKDNCYKKHPKYLSDLIAEYSKIQEK